MRDALRRLDRSDRLLLAMFYLEGFSVAEIAHITRHLIDDLVTTAPPKDRETEAAKARARAELRYAR